jgi:mannosyl-oligosaccharide glucosidase
MIGPILAALALQPISGLEKVPPQVRSIQNDQIQNQTLFWGTYRPNLFFGTRTRSKNTLMTGLMWQSLNSLELSDSNLLPILLIYF